LQRAVELRPDYAAAWIGLTCALTRAGQSRQAVAAGERAVQLRPDLSGAILNLASAYASLGQLDRACETLERHAHAPDVDPELISNLLLLLQSTERTPEAIVAWHRRYGQRVAAAAKPPLLDADPDRALRIGVLSADLRQHSVAFFTQGLFSQPCPGASFIVFNTSVPMLHDALTRQHRQLAAGWHEVAGMDDAELDACIRRERIDILLELSGHMAGHRLGALCAKPAPIIVTAIGYPSTTGHPCIDWRLVDSITDPPEADALLTERPLRLDPCFLCYTPPVQSPEPTSPADDAPFTFGSFNASSKISETTAALWAATLTAVPGSRLLLKSQAMGDPDASGALRDRLARAGIDPARVDISAYAPDQRSHLEQYARMHVSLDTTPYNGTTTTCEALWMGVPVVTLLGDRHAARVSASLLHAAGHPEWVAADADAYVRIAASLAQDRERLKPLRTDLRAQMLASPLLDAAAYATRFHAALRTCWRSLCNASTT
jgi:predicted O-linked N-acetylglucosamine transferase (SPINDLY family)